MAKSVKYKMREWHKLRVSGMGIAKGHVEGSFTLADCLLRAIKREKPRGERPRWENLLVKKSNARARSKILQARAVFYSKPLGVA